MKSEYLKKWRESNPDKVKKYAKEYRRRHVDELRKKACEWHKKWRERIKPDILTHYSNGKLACVKCGFDDIRALSIDHINGGGNKHRRGLPRASFSLYRWLKTNNYPEGYQTLCMNCQWIKRQENGER